MSDIRVATAMISQRIHAGKLNKKGDAFLANKSDVTSDVIKAIIEYVSVDDVHVVKIGGKPAYEISITKIV
jgi:hypothetical protein